VAAAAGRSGGVSTGWHIQFQQQRGHHSLC
jgi:hypothetical protein